MSTETLKLSGSVGQGGKNFPHDVMAVQRVLKMIAFVPFAPVKVNGIVDAPTIHAIINFQRHVVKMRTPDGRVDVGGNTAIKLASYLARNGGMGPFPLQPWAALGSPAHQRVATTVVFDPIGKTFTQRLDAFLADVDAKYGIKISKNAEFRQPSDAQKWHTAHMFYFNSYASRKPMKWEQENGRSVIAWSHISSASLVWHSAVQWADFLRDKLGRVPVKSADGKSWVAGCEPDRSKSKERAYKVLESAGIAAAEGGPAHSAMVAPGYDGCGEPCKCGSNRSRHIAGMACDLDRNAIAKLQAKLTPATKDAVNAYLKTFGLKRPMTSEPWHVEAT